VVVNRRDKRKVERVDGEFGSKGRLVDEISGGHGFPTPHQIGSVFRIPRPPEPVCRWWSRDYTSARVDSGEGLGWILGGSDELKPKPNTRCPIPDAQFKKPV